MNITKEWIFSRTINAFGTYNDQVFVEDRNGEDIPVVSIVLEAYDDVYETMYRRIEGEAKEEEWGTFEETLHEDGVTMTIYLEAGRIVPEGERYAGAILIVEDDKRCCEYQIHFSKEEREILWELAEAYCKASDGKSIDEFLREYAA